MDASAAVTATQMVATVVNTVRAAKELAKDISNHELKDKIGEIYDSLNDLRQRVLDLDEENRALKGEVAKKLDIEGPTPPYGYFYRKDHPQDPLCPTCYQSKESRLGFMGPQRRSSAGVYRSCHLCGKLIYEDRSQRSEIVIQSEWT